MPTNKSLPAGTSSQPKSLGPAQIKRSDKHPSQNQNVMSLGSNTGNPRIQNTRTALFVQRPMQHQSHKPKHRRPRIPSIRTLNCSRADTSRKRNISRLSMLLCNTLKSRSEPSEEAPAHRVSGARRSAMEAPYRPPPIGVSTNEFLKIEIIFGGPERLSGSPFPANGQRWFGQSLLTVNGIPRYQNCTDCAATRAVAQTFQVGAATASKVRTSARTQALTPKKGPPLPAAARRSHLRVFRNAGPNAPSPAPHPPLDGSRLDGCSGCRYDRQRLYIVWRSGKPAVCMAR